MNAAACSCRVSTSSIVEWRSASTTARFSSPGMPKIRSTPSFSRAATSKLAPLRIENLLYEARHPPKMGSAHSDFTQPDRRGVEISDAAATVQTPHFSVQDTRKGALD